MNYYPRYPGDYVVKTLDLTMTEDGAYTRLLDWYYSKEQPIPHARRHTITRATTPAEKTAVDTVLEMFFTRDGAHHHHERADEEITKASGRIQAAKLNGAKGGRRRKTEPKGNPPANPVGSGPVNPDGTQQASSPYPAPEPEEEATGDVLPPPAAGAGALTPSAYGLIAGELRRAGLPDAEAGSLRFRTLVDAGATAEEFLAFVPQALKSGARPFRYLVGAVEGERVRAAARVSELHRGEMPRREAEKDRAAREAVVAYGGASVAAPAPWEKSAAMKEPDDVVDVSARRVG